MRSLRRSRTLWLLALSMLLILGACSDDDGEAKDDDGEDDEKVEVYNPDPDPDATQISTYNEERLNDQADIEEDLMEEYEQGNYTYEEPFIKVDPYDTSPLSALIMFETDEPMQVRVTTGIDEGEEEIVKLWDEPNTSHEIPVLGLYPGEENTVKIEVIDEDNQAEEAEVVIETDPLPDDFLDTELVKAEPDKMENGLTFIVPTSGYLYAVDDQADVRWYSSLRSRLIFTRLSNGNFVQTTRADDADQYNELLELDMLGKIYNAYNIEVEGYDEEKDNLVHHEVIEVPSGNLLATTHETNSDYEEDHMHEIDRDTGITTQEINLRDAMPEDAPDDYDGKNAEDGDWIHQNAIFYDESDNSILISGRSQDIIMKLSYPEGEVQWILGADEEWPEEFEQYVLEPQGDVKFPAGQHAMKIVDNPEYQDNPEMKDIILFDNNEVFTRGDRDVSKDYSQAIRYLVNEEDMTVEETWSYGKDRGEEFFSHIIGNVQYLYDRDNIILNSGATDDPDSPTGVTGRVVEVDTSDDPEVYYELAIRGKDEDAVKYTYRTWRFPLYPDIGWDYSLKEE
ncbi:aryl-sulfate sulfotransferase [Virgibacillus sp. MSJ-26]|uniref:aryl-sulfate sulfotransferase n=1 Tax=Virgibacillus sp. MSJ-26 TaxID=2841522 RepID=UPI001C0F429A|nr:aryl-sulfate sulfotransferase [Virgibacillus sp. MSJ-26]MBU5465315.1 aryl-sulfate sulfotransferase [Virgibacillus sp. MSJ-26]